jgi:hypothetical protein
LEIVGLVDIDLTAAAEASDKYRFKEKALLILPRQPMQQMPTLPLSSRQFVLTLSCDSRGYAAICTFGMSDQTIACHMTGICLKP